MSKGRPQRFLCYLLMIYCLDLTPIRSRERETIHIPLGIICNTTDFPVDPDSVFNLDTLAYLSGGDNELVDCEILFTSSREDGRLCVLQDGPVNEIRDTNVQLIVKENTKTVFELNYYPSNWPSREYCTQSPSLSVALMKINKRVKVNVKNLQITLKIVNIESRSRTLYLNDISCSNSYPLRHSWVSVYNHSPHSPETLEYCGLKVEKEANRNVSICLVYKPLLHAQRQDTEWKFYVSTKEFDLDPNFFIYQLVWNSSQACTVHAWCADPAIGKVMLIFHRLNKTHEQQDMFVFTLTDYEGSNDTLLELWNKPLHDEDTETGTPDTPKNPNKPKGPGASSSRLCPSLPHAALTLVIALIGSLEVNAFFGLASSRSSSRGPLVII